MSMTGYGRAEASESGMQVTIEIKSVNHRFLEVNVKAPSRMFLLDDLIKKMIKDKFARGYFDVMVAMSADEDLATTVSVNESLLKGYLAAAKDLAEEYGVNYPPQMGDLLQIKDLFNSSGREFSLDEWRTILKKVMVEALDQVGKIRVVEGASTLADVKVRFGKISDLLVDISAWADNSIQDRFLKLKSRMEKLTKEVGMDEARISQEAAVMADKSDVSEELSRIKSHLSQVDALLSSDEPIGRKLEFFLQEINRETNTVGSKTLSSDSAGHVVEIKSELEKIREQAQNLE